jgi:hypothetical protein
MMKRRRGPVHPIPQEGLRDCAGDLRAAEREQVQFAFDGQHGALANL